MAQSGKFDAAMRDVLVRAAILAPSMHNTQPWRFRFWGRTVEVHSDPRYALPVADPKGRMLLISTGAALFNLRVAAARHGYETTVTIPDRLDATLAATVRLDPLASEERSEIGILYAYLGRRRTNRERYEDRAIAEPVREELIAAADSEDATLELVVDPFRRDQLLSLAADGTLDESADPAREAERRRWVGGERDRDGIPSASLGPRPARPSAPVRDLAADRADRARQTGRFESAPVLAVLATRFDSPRDWLVAGQALQRVLLVATRRGLATSLLTQAFEHDSLRWQVRDTRSGLSRPQVVIRLGYGPDVPPTPRRPAAEFIVT
jgi:nitroreductase